MLNVKKVYIGKPKYLPGQGVYGYLIENLLTPDGLQSLLSAFNQKFMPRGLEWDKTLVTHNGRVHGMGQQRQDGAQRYIKIFDVPEHNEYYYQTKDTVYNWAHDVLIDQLPPIFYKTIKIIENNSALGEEPGCWVPVRAHINVHEWDHLLAAHTDMDMGLFNCDHYDSKQYSVTVYLDELTLGGEFWADTDVGFVYKPQANTALMIPGNKFVHGVNANQDEFKRPRRAYTMRFVHVDTLYLPGHPDKCLYRPASMDQITA